MTPFQEDRIKKYFVKSCENGDLLKIKEIVASSEVSSQKLVHYDNNAALFKACKNGHLDIARYLLTSKELEQKANINGSRYTPLHAACMNGHLHIVQYLLTSNELKKHADLHAYNDEVFITTCKYGHLDVVKYLTRLLENKIDIGISEKAFLAASENNHLNIAAFFITELNIPKTSHITYYLKKAKRKEIEKLFSLRDLNNELSNELIDKGIKIDKKIKL
jgi:ankyrin repeat protein